MRMSSRRDTRQVRRRGRRPKAVRLRLGLSLSLSLRKREGFSLLGVSDGGRFWALDSLPARRAIGSYPVEQSATQGSLNRDEEVSANSNYPRDSAARRRLVGGL